MTSTIVREAKRTAITNARQGRECPDVKYCGQPIPGRRNPNQASSSPTAHAMYLSNTPSTGLTQSIRIPPPAGYSNTVCCGGGSTGRELQKIEPPVVAGGVNSGIAISHVPSSTYRGRGTLPKRNWQPSQLAPWRMGPTPNRMQRIGNVRPQPSEPRQQIVSKRTATMSASEHITSVREEAIALVDPETSPCMVPKYTADTVITFDGIRKVTYKTSLDCERPPQSKGFAGTGMQRYTTADLPLLVRCAHKSPAPTCQPEC
jgi:hypothetical protein